MSPPSLLEREGLVYADRSSFAKGLAIIGGDESASPSSICCRRSLLFDLCHSAAREGKRCSYICQRGAIDSALPLPVVLGDAANVGERVGDFDPGALSRIGMKYVETAGDLAWYLASLQLLDREQLPELLAVDELDVIAGKRREEVSHLLAALDDTCAFLGSISFAVSLSASTVNYHHLPNSFLCQSLPRKDGEFSLVRSLPPGSARPADFEQQQDKHTLRFCIENSSGCSMVEPQANSADAPARRVLVHYQSAFSKCQHENEMTSRKSPGYSSG
jgi:hypothetical protein